MLEALKNSSGANLQGELSHVIRQLQACSLVPGMRTVTKRMDSQVLPCIRGAASINCFTGVACPSLTRSKFQVFLASLASNK